VRGAGAGTGAAVAAVAVHAGVGLMGPSRTRASSRGRWLAYAAAGATASATVGPWLVVVLLACGSIEAGLRTARRPTAGQVPLWPMATVIAPVGGGLLALGWVALKVGALSYGGGFVIIPLMRADAVEQYHWMTDAQFLNAVALGQITPGPVVQTIAVVGYAAAGVAGGLLAALIAFTPSFAFVLIGAPHFDWLRRNQSVMAFLDGAGPAAIGAIIGVAGPLALGLTAPWQLGVLAGAAVALFVLRRDVVTTLLLAGAAGVVAGQLGAPLR
jgi:chromate transporter